MKRCLPILLASAACLGAADGASAAMCATEGGTLSVLTAPASPNSTALNIDVRGCSWLTTTTIATSGATFTTGVVPLAADGTTQTTSNEIPRDVASGGYLRFRLAGIPYVRVESSFTGSPTAGATLTTRWYLEASASSLLESNELSRSALENDITGILADTYDFHVANPPSGGGPGGAVELSAADRERLDLGWWGTWAIVGLLLVLMIAPAFSSAMRVTRGM